MVGFLNALAALLSRRGVYDSRAASCGGMVWSYMASKGPEEFILYVFFEDRDDGGLRARCPTIPNFYLSHSDPELVRKDVEPALATILSEMYGIPMSVRYVPDMSEVLDHQIPMPHVCDKRSYVGHIHR